MHKEHVSFTPALLFSSTRHSRSVVFGEYLEKIKVGKPANKSSTRYSFFVFPSVQALAWSEIFFSSCSVSLVQSPLKS